MSAERLAGVLEDAVHSLTAFDAERLERLERELSAELASGADSLFTQPGTHRDDAIRAVLATHRLLGSLLESTNMNLNVLHTLQRRSDMGEGRWGR